MTTTEEKNAVIAVYMGGKWQPNKKCWLIDHSFLHSLAYNISYDWLMPVVSKVVKDVMDMGKADYRNDIYNALLSIDITKLFEAVYTAITYINEVREKK